MLREIATEVDALLVANHCPLRVFYAGEDRSGAALHRPRIVIERDRQAGDTIGPRRAEARNPRMFGVRAIGARCRIFAQSTEAGAMEHDHERMVDQALDQLQVALHKVISARKTLWKVSSARLLTPEEIEQTGLLTWNGVVYELKFSVDRGVYDTEWTGAHAAEADIDSTFGIGWSSRVGLAHQTDSLETLCGGEHHG